MDRNGQVRKEPSLADLEAFEQLLRESLHAAPAKPAAAAQPVVVPPAPPEPPQAGKPGHDEIALAELTRLIEAPVDFSMPPLRGAINEPQPAPAAPEPQHYGQAAVSQQASQPELQTAHEPLPPATPSPELSHLSGHAEAALTAGWNAAPQVEARFEVPAADPPAPQAAMQGDPLASFEEELRRFDAVRLREAEAAHAASYAAQPAPHTEPTVYAPQHYPYETPAPAAPQQGQGEAEWYPTAPQGQQAAYPPEYPEAPAPDSSLNAAEERLAAEAAAAAAAARSLGQTGRSKGVFMALGGIAVAGLAVIGGVFAFGGGKKPGGSDVPTIAAKSTPTKEKPADPGGMEIPNQNKQVLASRNTPEAKPASVVNTTEQPVDLNQVAKKNDGGVRVIAPSPYQPGEGNPPQPGQAQPGVEARRVTSIRIPTGSEPSPPPAAAVPGVPPIVPMTVPSVPQGVTSRPATPPVPAAPSPRPPSAPTTTPSTTSAPVAPPKNETRPEMPKATPPKVATTQPPKAPPAPKANAPLSLDPGAQAGAPKAQPTRTASAPSGGSGGWAIQLASRPDEASARTASSQLKTKYASAIGGRSPSVVSGEANGKSVYRVRVGGYSQQEATAACEKVKAAGGGCFITKQ